MISPIVNLVLALPSLPSIPSGFAVWLYYNITMSCCPLSLISQADITYMEWNLIHMIPYSEVLGHILQLRILSPLISRHVEAFFLQIISSLLPQLVAAFSPIPLFPSSPTSSTTHQQLLSTISTLCVSESKKCGQWILWKVLKYIWCWLLVRHS